MRNLATASFQTEFVKEPLTITVTPEAILHKEGTRVIYFVYIDIYDGGVQKVPESIGSLGTDDGGYLADGIRWWYYPSAERAGYRIECTAAASLASTLSIPFTFAYNGKSYTRAFSITTVKDGDTGGQGTDGKAGPYIPEAMLWHDYPDGFQFQSGNLSADPPETRIDFVLMKNDDNTLTRYRCKNSHSKTSRSRPGYNDWCWEKFELEKYTSVATQFFAADNARIDFLSGQAIRVGDSVVWGYFGAPYLGEEIIYTGHSASWSSTVNYTPAYATFAINKSGYARWGEPTGKRIEVNPDEVAVKIYESGDTPSVTISGEPKSISGAIPGAGAATSVTGAKINRSSTASMSVTDKMLPASSTDAATPAAAADGYAKISIPVLNLNAECNPNATGIISDSVNLSVTILVYAITTAGAATTEKVMRRLSYSVKAGGWTTVDGETLNNQSQFIPKQSVSIPIKAGQKVRVDALIEAKVIGTNSQWSVNSGVNESQNKFTCDFTYQGRQCLITPTGIFLSSDSNNYFYIAFDASNKLKFGCKIDGVEKILANKT